MPSRVSAARFHMLRAPRRIFPVPGPGEIIRRAGEAATHGPTWFSEVERLVDRMMGRRAPAQQIEGILRGRVKKDALETSKIVDLLLKAKSEKRLLTKEEVLGHLKANEVKLVEVVKGKGLGRSEEEKIVKAQVEDQISGDPLADQALYLPPGIWSKMTKEERLAQLRSNPAMKDDINGYVADELALEVFEGETKFETWQLPGGENYRELLITLGSQPKHLEWKQGRKTLNLSTRGGGMVKEFDVWTGGDNQIVFIPVRGYVLDGGQGRIQNAAFETLALAKAEAEEVAGRSASFTSSHWSEPNVLVHVRFNERKAADGKRTLFIEEIQSDWHQKGRKEGYSTGRTVEEIDRELDAVIHDLEIREGGTVGTFTQWKRHPDLLARHTELMAERNRAGVPDAPFKTTWHELAMKRMFRWAAENGFDRVAWTTGAQQVDRYEEALRKTVDRIEWTKTAEGVHIKGLKTPADIRPVTVVDTLQRENELSDAIGKAMADQILADPAQSGIIEAANFKISDTGMAGFYDRILPNWVDDYTKKWGGHAGSVDLQAVPRKTRLSITRNLQSGMWQVTEAGETVLVEFTTRREAQRYMRDLRTRMKVHSLDLTPAMKKAVLEGQPISGIGEVAPPDNREPEVLLA